MFRLPFVLLSGLCAVLMGCHARAETRLPIAAGTFYPADSTALSVLVQSHLAAAVLPDPVEGDLLALIVPHAGLVYSGAIAAHAYRLLDRKDVHTVVLCGPSHRFPVERASVYGPGVEWQTPLGTVSCNADLCDSLLLARNTFSIEPRAHMAEHCLEVQLPYLQMTLQDFKLVPVAFNSSRESDLNPVAEALAGITRSSDVVMVASTDWQHFRSAGEGWPLDSLGMDCVQHLDPEALAQNLRLGRTEACGGAAAVAVLKAALALGADTVQILKYGHSGQVSSDNREVVGYLAAAIYRTKSASHHGSKAKAQKESAVSGTYVLVEEHRKLLLQIAREAIDAHLNDRQPPEWRVPALLAEPGAAFVTLKHNGELRGCIGHTVAVMPLYETVAYCAIHAAVADPRFSPVRIGELAQLDIEISVLTPLQRVKAIEEIAVGRDGLMISLGGQRGLLLPQVATEYNWDRTEFLQHTCRKAGLPTDAYKSPQTVIERFQAIVFGELER